jgi:hypothetical protein
MSTELNLNAFPRTYRSAVWIRALMLTVALALLALSAGLLFVGASAPATAPARSLMIIAAALAVGAVLFGLYVLRWKVVLTQGGIEVHGLFTTRRLALGEIAGRRRLSAQYGQKVLQLIPREAAARALKIPESGLKRDAALDAWLAQLPDLDAQEQAASQAAITENADFGSSPDERLARLAAAKRLASAVTVLVFAACAWGYLYPRPYGVAIAVLTVLPWLVVAIVFRSQGLLRVSTQRNDVRPSLALCLYLPGLALIARVFGDVGVIDLQRAIVLAIAVTLALAGAALASEKGARGWGLRLALALFSLPYGYGAVVMADAQLDRGARQDFTVAVLSRHMTHGRSNSYYLMLGPWGPRAEPEEVMVNSALYRTSPPGSTVCIQLRPGALAIRWFWIGPCP